MRNCTMASFYTYAFKYYASFSFTSRIVASLVKWLNPNMQKVSCTSLTFFCIKKAYFLHLIVYLVYNSIYFKFKISVQ